MNAPQDPAVALSLYNDTVCWDTGRYFCDQRPFSLPRTGNKVTMLSCGKNVLRNIYEAITRAESFIWIADWQMGFDIELVRRGYKSDHSGQLHKVIEKVISTKPVHVRILLFSSLKDTIPGTYDGLVAAKINSLNKRGYPGSVLALCQKPTSAQRDSYEYSHHQKFVVVDGRIGFLGGIDLSYGRWESPEFDVVVDPGAFVGNEMYNPCAVKLRTASESEKIDIRKFDFNNPYNGVLIDEGCQPRMPWQDVHVQIEGPSVVDIHRNFVRRWNSHRKAIFAYPEASWIRKAWLQKIGAWQRLESVQSINGGGAQIQIVRSVSNAHLRQEAYTLDDLELFPKASERETWKTCIESWRGEHQDNILEAMVNCIRSADNYIYIETQFFISNFGQWRSNQGHLIDSTKIGNEDDGVRNIIIDALAARIYDHIKAKSQFHVYLVIPTHPEGLLSDPAVMNQHRLALLTIKHGSNSLVKKISTLLKTVKRDPKEWANYLTVLNMRSYGATVQYARDPITLNEDFGCEIGRFVVTEQIYIHSKLLIVDDAVAIVGSANINDRSLTGNGDSEIAAVIVDTDGIELRNLGSPSMKVQTRRFARELRRQLWMKHFGFMVESTDEGNTKYFRSSDRASRKLHHVPAKIPHPPRIKTTEKRIMEVGGVNWEEILDMPCAPSVVNAIRQIAQANARNYERVFIHTPRNTMTDFASSSKTYSLPYPPTFAPEETRLRYEYFARRPLLNASANEMREISARKKQYFRDAVDMAGRDPKHAGVIPPALANEFMTTELLSHQRASVDPAQGGRSTSLRRREHP